MGIKRSTYYYKPKCSRTSEADLTDRIEEIALQYPSYGYRRITAELRRKGLKVNHKRVLRLMRSQNLLCRAQKSFKATTNSAHSLKKYPNLIEEDLVPVRTSQLWHSGITYIRLEASFVCLAAIIDGFSRKVVGYGLEKTLSADLALAALLNAVSKRNTDDLIHHSDQGIQYYSAEYVEILKEYDIAISMSGKANPYDNAKIKSFFRTLKVEEVYMFEYDTYREVLSIIPHFIEEVYNRKRLHSSQGICPRKNLKI